MIGAAWLTIRRREGRMDGSEQYVAAIYKLVFTYGTMHKQKPHGIQMTSSSRMSASMYKSWTNLAFIMLHAWALIALRRWFTFFFEKWQKQNTNRIFRVKLAISGSRSCKDPLGIWSPDRAKTRLSRAWCVFEIPAALQGAQEELQMGGYRRLLHWEERQNWMRGFLNFIWSQPVVRRELQIKQSSLINGAHIYQ
jgi:hypothetical protein